MPTSPRQDDRKGLADRYRALLDVGRVLAGTLSTEELYRAIHAQTARVLHTAGFYISLYDQANDLARVVYYADGAEARQVDVTYRGSDSQVIRDAVGSLVTDDLPSRSILVLGDKESAVTRSAVSAPMHLKGQVVGVVSAQSYEANAYTEEDLDLLQGIADIASVAIDNALHVEELERRRKEAERIEEIGRAVAASLDPKEVLRQIVVAVNDVLDADGASVWMCESPGESVVFEVVASEGDIALPTGLKWDFTPFVQEGAVDLGRPLVVEDLARSPLVPAHAREYLQAGSGIAVPLHLADQLAGALSAGSRRTHAFDKDDLAVLQRLAAQASVALGNARLHAHLQSLSLTDALTGLPNRRRLQIHLDKEVAAAKRGRGLVLVVFDLDDFKQYNDTLGHIAGDEILCAFARILDDENRAMNLVARFGGDEFMSVLSETHMDGARMYVRRVGERVAEDPVLGRHGVAVSAGLAEFDRTSMKSGEDLIRAADADMYRTKATHHGEDPRAASL